MNVEQVKELANTELTDALACCGMGDLFTVIAIGELDGLEGEFYSIEYEIVFEFGNIKRTHSLQVGWTDEDGIGLEYGEDGDIKPITYGNVVIAMYFDIALIGLDDKHLP